MNFFTKSRSLINVSGQIASFCNKAVKENISKMVKNNKVVVFMKGVPEQPRCGFSNAVVQILRMHGVNYDSHDVLSDEALRQGFYSLHSSKSFSKRIVFVI